MNTIPSSAIVCSRPTDENGRQCDNGAASGPVVVDLRTFFPDGCTKVDFVAWDVLAAGVNPTSTHVDNTATFSIATFDPSSCKFELILEGTVGAVLFRTTKLIGLDVTLENDHVLLPLLVSIGGTCNDDKGCENFTTVGEALDRCH